MSRPLCLLTVLAIAGCDRKAVDTGNPALPIVVPDIGVDPDCTPLGRQVFEEMPMIHVCSGTFMMGSPEDEVGRTHDEVEHVVSLTHPFWMGEHEVTQAEYVALMGQNPSAWAGCDNCPVERVTWHMSAAFANAVSDAAGLEKCYTCEDKGEDTSCSSVEDPYACEGYRLPTEAEWEYAARAGTTSAFANGGSLLAGDELACEGNLELSNGTLLDDITVYCGNQPGPTVDEPDHAAEVASKAPNAWGLYDMHGNVMEWCWDLFDAEGFGTLPVVDPKGADGSYTRATRGGAWSGVPSIQRSANRSADDSYVSGNIQGLRLARTDAPSER